MSISIDARRDRTRLEVLSGILWAIARVWVGWQFLSAALDKIGAPAWTGAAAGAQIRTLLGAALSPKMTQGAHPNVLGPYAWLIRHVFLPNAAPLAYLVTAAEFLVGLALLLGFCTRIAAAGGACLNLLYLLSGSVGVNPVMLTLELAIVLAGTTAGLIGLDLFLMPSLRQHLMRSDDRAPAQPVSTVPRRLTRTG
ncbi:MAG TPA: DoxX family protein [Chloroflexota bacterium]|jgi:thiosulfate dehydrogenase [quinone] large subunit|nr:DoxX family protein [Chloroflexota bacterium]